MSKYVFSHIFIDFNFSVLKSCSIYVPSITFSQGKHTFGFYFWPTEPEVYSILPRPNVPYPFLYR